MERIPFPYLCANKLGKDTIANREVHNWYKYLLDIKEDVACYNFVVNARYTSLDILRLHSKLKLSYKKKEIQEKSKYSCHSDLKWSDFLLLYCCDNLIIYEEN